VDENGNHQGEVAIEDALDQARQKGFDLIEVAPKAKPPVCKIIDFGKFKYQQEKAEQKAKQKQKKVELKGIRLTLKMGEHDLEVRIKQAKKFLEKGDKVKVEMRLRGREMAHQDLARKKITKYIESFEDIQIEQPITRQGRLYSVIINKK